jgi:hypothetical protein
MTNLDDRITETLRSIPTAAQRPLAEIQARGRRRKRRRSGAVGVAALGVIPLVLVPLANALGDDGTDGTSIAGAPEPPPCPTAAWEAGNAREELYQWDWLSDAAEVPDELRLLWPESVAPPPVNAEATESTAAVPVAEWYASCAITRQEAKLVYLDDDVVTSTISISYTSIPYEHPPAMGDEPSPIERVIPTADGEIGVWHGEPGKGVVHASWGDDSASWDVTTKHALTDDELVELADTALFVDGTIDLGAWSALAELQGPNDAEHLTQASLAALAPVLYGFNLELANAGGSVSIYTSSEELLGHARPGNKVIDLNGQPALLEQVPTDDPSPGSVTITWKPSPDVLASVTADAGHDELVLDIARSVGPIPPDDPRLTGVWFDPLNESGNE